MKSRIIITSFAALSLLITAPVASVFAEDAKPESPPVLTGPEAKPDRGNKEGSRRGFDGKQRKGKRGGDVLKRLFKDIELTDTQKESFREVMSEFRAEAKTFRDKNKDAMQSMRESFKEARENQDVETMRSLGEQRKKLMEDRPKLTDHTDKIKAILTEEQYAQFTANVEEMKQRRANRGPKGKKGEKGQKGNRGKSRSGPDANSESKNEPKPSGSQPANEGLEL